MFGQLDDLAAARRQPWFNANIASAQRDLRCTIDRLKGKSAIDVSEVRLLVRQYSFLQALSKLTAIAPRLFDEDTRRRYAVEDDVLIKTAYGACTDATRQRAVAIRLVSRARYGRLEGIQPRQEVCFSFPPRRFSRPELRVCLLQRAALRLEVRLRIVVRRFEAGVSEPASDHRHVNTGGHQMNGSCVAKQVRGNTLLEEGRHLFGGRLYIVSQSKAKARRG